MSNQKARREGDCAIDLIQFNHEMVVNELGLDRQKQEQKTRHSQRLQWLLECGNIGG